MMGLVSVLLPNFKLELKSDTDRTTGEISLPPHYMLSLTAEIYANSNGVFELLTTIIVFIR